MTASTVSHALSAAKWIGRLAYTIAAIGIVASYGTQVALLRTYEVGTFSYVIPATIDLLAVCGALVLQLPGLDRTSRRIAGGTLTIAVSVSVAANVTDAHNPIAAAAHAWPVIAYLLGELLANRVRTYAQRLTAEAQAPAAVAECDEAPAKLPMPVSPAPAGRKPYGPRNGAEYSERHTRRLVSGK